MFISTISADNKKINIHKYLLLSISIFSLLVFDVEAGVIRKPMDNRGLVGYWTLNEGAGNFAADSSGNGNSGTLTNGPSWVDGKRGKALNFDGSNDEVNAGSPATLDNLTEVTFSAWIQPRSNGGGGFGRIVVKGSPSPDGFWAIQMNNTVGAIAMNASFTGGTVQRISAENSFSYGRWQHFVGTWDGTNLATGIKIFANGVEVASYQSPIDGTNPRIDDSGTALHIGNRLALDRAFDGLIDDVRIYNRALSAAEVKTLYQSGSARIKAPTNNGLVGYWSMNEGTGNVASDGSGSQNHGNLEGGPSWVNGPRGKALEFSSAASDRINAGSAASVDDLGPLTASAWVYLRNFNSSGAQSFLSRITSKSVSAGFWRFDIENAAANPARFLFSKDYDGAADVSMTSDNNTVPTNTWFHAVVTWDGTANSSGVKIYKNGELLAAGPVTEGAGSKISDDTGVITVGDNAGGTRPCDCIIDEMRLYNRALSAAEVKTLYQSGSVKIKAPTNNGLVGYWSMNEGTGNRADDSSGNNNHGTLTNGPTWVAGKKGKALDFDGSNDYVEIGDRPEPLSAITVAAWVRPMAVAANQSIVAKYHPTNSLRRTHLLATDDSQSDRFTFEIFDSSANNTTCDSNAAGTYTSGQWVFVVGTFFDPDSAVGNNGVCNIYVNGVDRTTVVSTSGDSLRDTDTPIRFGVDDSQTRWFTGLIDDVRIYNRALSAAEVKQLYESR